MFSTRKGGSDLFDTRSNTANTTVTQEWSAIFANRGGSRIVCHHGEIALSAQRDLSGPESGDKRVGVSRSPVRPMWGAPCSKAACEAEAVLL